MTLSSTVKVYKVRVNSKLPHRAHSTDAGLDFFYCPEGSVKFTTLEPGQSGLFPTGVKIQVPRDHMLQIMNKSGVASKRSLLVGACVVDEGYTGEVFVNLHNVGTEKQLIESGHKIAQGVFIRISKPELLEISNPEELYEGSTSRGDGALGSTGEV